MLSIFRKLPGRTHGRAYQASSFYTGPFPPRTHTCGALSRQDIGNRVVLTGWISTERKVSKSLSFFDIKDSSGSTQLLVRRNGIDKQNELSTVPVESVVAIEGEVRARREDTVRPGSGEIEVHVENIKLLNPAEQLPFSPSDSHNLANEDLRARYRYLDLRRPTLSSNLRKRSDVSRVVRNVLQERDFIEVETPILLRSSPEGAREYLVPARSSLKPQPDDPPLFYALSQSPQQPKQLLIASGGIDKYFQFARCFRDEDGRTDRQPEFTQIDLEMAYVSQGADTTMNGWNIGGAEVRNVVEAIVKEIWWRILGFTLPLTFPVLTYHEAMTRFGSDKPDTRFGLEITDLTGLVPKADSSHIDAGLALECLVIKKEEYPELFSLTAEELGLSPADKELVERLEVTGAPEWLKHSRIFPCNAPVTTNARSGNVIWLSTRPRLPEGGSTPLGRLRLRLSERLSKRDANQIPQFLWITEFPLFTKADDDKNFLAQGRWSSSHHPFTAPMWQDIPALLSGKYAEVRGQHYDLVLNGTEIAGGSVRIHDAKLQEMVFRDILQLDESEISSFSQLLHALKCGAPPHGGIAIGFDRLMAILCGERSIRQVIAFPKTLGGVDPLFKSPAPVPDRVLAQYRLQSTAS